MAGEQFLYHRPTFPAQLDMSHPLTRGLKGCWVFNENSPNAMRVWDSSLYANHGRVLAGTKAYHNGRIFSGNTTNDVVNTTFQSQLDGEVWTLVFWAKPSTVTVTSRYLATTAAAVANGGFQVRQRVSGGFDCMVFTNNSNLITTGTYIGTNDVWGCYAYVYNNGLPVANKLRGFFNGVDSAGDTIETLTFTGMTASPNSLKFGTQANEPANTFLDAIIGLFLPYNRVLSAAEIKELYLDPYAMFLR